jgi:hypothetical protein
LIPVLGGAVAILVTGLAAPDAALARHIACGPLTVDRSEVRVSGLLGDEDSFTQSFRVTTRKKSQKPVFDVDRDLAAPGPFGRTISQARVDVANRDTPLVPKQPAAIRVTVKGIRFAEEYRGVLLLRGSRCRIPLVVTAGALPELGLVGGGGDKTAHVLFARCAHATCGADSGALLSDQRLRDEFTIQVDNASQSPVEVTDIAVSVRGDPGERGIPAGALTPSSPTADLNAGAVSNLPPITVARDRMSPGHYTGAVYLTANGAEKRTVIPLEIDIKDGPFWAIIVLLVALSVQVLVWVGVRNRPRKAALRARHQLRVSLSEYNDDDVLLLAPRLDALRAMIVDGRLEEASAASKTIETDAAVLGSARELEAVAQKLPKGVPVDVATTLSALRAAVKDGQSAKANGLLTDLRHAVSVPAETPDVASLKKMEQKALPTGSFKLLLAEGETTPNFGLTDHLAQWLHWIKAKLKYAWLLFTVYPLPWLLRTVFVVAFVFAGLKELYFTDATFGDEWVFDYGAIFLVGLAATAVNEALGKIIPEAAEE